MSEPRKLAVIGYCAQCPHYRYTRSRLSGSCGKEGKQIQLGYAPIPDWCPLPDAPEGEGMTLRPIAYGTGLTLSTDGKLRIQPIRSRYDREIVIQERPSYKVTRWSINEAFAGSSCLNRDGDWEYEPLPSNRDDEFFARCRFASLEEAVEFLNSASTPALNDANSASRGEK